MSAPTPQKNLPISFVLDDGDRSTTELALPIRPEDLTRTEPSQVTASKTLDGAFLDSFGRGLAQIQINGHTGWGQSDRPDGVKKFAELRDDYVHRWHRLRESRIAAGRDPDDVRLLFADTLNGDYVATVAPLTFALKRSKSNPLLMFYNLSLAVLDDQATRPFVQSNFENFRRSELAYGALSPAGQASLANSVKSIDSLTSRLDQAMRVVGSLGAAVQAATRRALLPILSVANGVTRTAGQINGLVTSSAGILIGVASQAARAGAAIWNAVAAVASVPLNLKVQALQVKAAFSNAFCLLSGALNGSGAAFDYSAFYGASNCSSTAGGRPLSVLRDVNGFETFNQAVPAPLQLTPQAVDSFKALTRLDVLRPPTTGAITGYAAAIASGVQLRA